MPSEERQGCLTVGLGLLPGEKSSDLRKQALHFASKLQTHLYV